MIYFNETKSPKKHLQKFRDLLAQNVPFQYVRFSDGEMEVLCGRKLEIKKDSVFFKGQSVKNVYLPHDFKNFDPKKDDWLRRELVSSAQFRSTRYLKGIPTSHNNCLDKGIMIGFNGGDEDNLTFSDLFMNNNYAAYAREVLPLIVRKADLVIANWRFDASVFKNQRTFLIKDNAFQDAKKIKSEFICEVKKIPDGSVIVSSASSLSNVFGCYIAQFRPNVTFVDVGSTLNHLIGLPIGVRKYQRKINVLNPFLSAKIIAFRLSKKYRIRW